MQDYFDEMHKALKDFHTWDEKQANPQLKPLYMLIKVDVDKDIVYNQDQAALYAFNHCNRMEYVLIDSYYPDSEQYPYIARRRSLYAYSPL